MDLQTIQESLDSAKEINKKKIFTNMFIASAIVGVFSLYFFYITIPITLLVFIKKFFNHKLMFERFERYVEVIFKSKNSISFDVLQVVGNVSKDQLIKDFKMLRTFNCLPNFRICPSQNRITFVGDKLDKDADSMELDLDEENLGNKNSKPKKQQSGYGENFTEFVLQDGDMQAEARQFLDYLAYQNELCKDEEVSDRISRLRKAIGKLVAYGYKNQEDRQGIKTLNKKYLQTAIKLINKYAEMELHVNGSSTYTATKNQIITSLDNLIVGYDTYLENLYSDDVMDISSDITVLDTLLAQDGLSESDFKIDM